MTEHLNAAPLVDNSPVCFEVRNGMRRVSCVVSDEALDAVSSLPLPSTSGLRRRSFDRFRTLIHAAAQLKLNALPSEFSGSILLNTEDLRSVPPEKGVPVFGSAARTIVRPVPIGEGEAISSQDPLTDILNRV